MRIKVHTRPMHQPGGMACLVRRVNLCKQHTITSDQEGKKQVRSQGSACLLVSEQLEAAFERKQTARVGPNALGRSLWPCGLCGLRVEGQFGQATPELAHTAYTEILREFDPQGEDPG